MTFLGLSDSELKHPKQIRSKKRNHSSLSLWLGWSFRMGRVRSTFPRKRSETMESLKITLSKFADELVKALNP